MWVPVFDLPLWEVRWSEQFLSLFPTIFFCQLPTVLVLPPPTSGETGRVPLHKCGLASFPPCVNLYLLQVVVQDFYLLIESPLMSLGKISLDSPRTGFQFSVLLHTDYCKSPHMDHSIFQSLSLLKPKVNRCKTTSLHGCWTIQWCSCCRGPGVLDSVNADSSSCVCP